MPFKTNHPLRLCLRDENGLKRGVCDIKAHVHQAAAILLRVAAVEAAASIDRAVKQRRFALVALVHRREPADLVLDPAEH